MSDTVTPPCERKTFNSARRCADVERRGHHADPPEPGTFTTRQRTDARAVVAVRDLKWRRAFPVVPPAEAVIV
jgi:hypothetical protein